MGLAVKIKKLRELRDLTQEHMAKELGMDQSAYSRIEKGMTRITHEKLVKIATVLNVEPEEIYSFDEANIFNIKTLHQNGDNGTINHAYSKEEKKLYEEMIKTLREENEYLKKTLDKVLAKG